MSCLAHEKRIKSNEVYFTNSWKDFGLGRKFDKGVASCPHVSQAAHWLGDHISLSSTLMWTRSLKTIVSTFISEGPAGGKYKISTQEERNRENKKEKIKSKQNKTSFSCNTYLQKCIKSPELTHLIAN